MAGPLRSSTALRVLRGLVLPEAGRWAAVVACTVAVAASAVALASLSGRVFAAIAARGAGPTLGLLLSVAGVAVARGAAGYARAVVLSRIEESAVSRLRIELHQRLLEAELAAVRAARAAELGGRLAYEADGVRWLLGFGLAGAIHNAVIVVALLVVLARVDLVLALAAIALLPLVALAAGRLGQRSRAAAEAAAEARAEVATAASEHAALLPLARAHGAEPTLAERYRARVANASERSLEATRVAARVAPMVQALGALFGAALFALVLARRASEAEGLATALAALALLYGPAKSLATSAHGFVAGLASLDRLAALLDLPLHRSPLAGPRATPQGHSLEARGLTISYGEKNVLEALELAVPSGETVAIVGANGAGKSTLLLALGGLLRPSAGGVFLGGVDVTSLDPDAARACFGWVSAEPAMLRDTVLANVTLGDDAPSESRARAALSAAGAERWLDALPLGLATAVDESLSTGERQRLALARALYRDPPILLLDEPTAALDPESAASLTRTLQALAGSRTVIFTSHREPLVRLADRVLALSGGALDEVSAAPIRSLGPRRRRARRRGRGSRGARRAR